MGPYDYRLDADIVRPKSTIEIKRDGKHWAKLHVHMPSEPEDIKVSYLLMFVLVLSL